MNKAKSGNRAGDFATQHREALLEQATYICRNENDAEDLVHETLVRFIQTFGTAEDLPSQRSCEAWLARTLTHLFIDHCRRRRVQAQNAKDPVLSSQLTLEQELSAVPTYAAITDEQIAQALDELSPKARAIIELHHVEGHKYRDIARSLGIQVGAVGKRLHDARTKLRKFLQRYLSPGMH
jgi:RNA polymerase sigma-70 factor (ECF subfamily)